MYHYLFTNDLRISVLDESLKKAGHCFVTNTVPTATEDKSANNNMMTLGFYFNLNGNSNCAKNAESGNTRAVVLNFIKKFQFPNMRTSAAFNASKEDGIMLVPMRLIIKLLYAMSLLYGNTTAYLTKDEIKYFIFYNDSAAKTKFPNISELINDIIDYRRTGNYPSSVSLNEVDHEWKHEDRQIREMLKVLQWSGCISEKDGKFVIDNDELTRNNKADIYDIITCNSFWDGDTKESYCSYMDMDISDVSREDDEEEIQDDNEYKRAADILTKHIEESGLELPSNDDVTEQCRAEFMERYSPDKLEALSDSELLEYIFYSDGDNSESLCYWIERNPQCREFFGSISGGSAYKFGLFKKKDTGVWTSGSANNSKELTDEEALQLGKSIRDALVNGSRLIAEANPQTIEECEKMDDDLKELIGDQFYNMAWFHKYYAITTGDILSCYHNDVWKYHILYALLIKPSEKSYARSGQIAMVRRYANMSYNAMHHVIVDKFGMPKTFVRIGTTDEKMNYTDEWKKRSVVGIGWKDIGSLDSYLYGDGIDKKAIADKLQEIYYGNDARTASRKAGELVRFYKTNEDTVFVAMSGERLIAFVDGIGNYFYDSSSDMSHMKPGRWHENFTPADVLPEKSEGKLTSCYQLTAEYNLMYLYRKYYYPDDDMELEVNLESEAPEERNKRLFRYWMGLQVKPEGDSDAGNPYSEQSIDSYVNSIEKTPLPMVAEHSVFYTTDIGQVNQAMDELKKEPEKNGSQRSAVKKYIQYLIDSEEDYMKLIYNTNIDVDYERNRIVFGAPGTGKSFGLKDDCDKLMEDTVGTYERVTFHPDYSYSQFVGTYKPVMDADGRSIRYDFVPGPFMRVYVDALKSGRTEAPQPHLLLIEEINRAKVAAVFGDVFQLLDRDDDGVSEYEIQASEDIRRYLASQLGGDADNYKKIRIPNNMFIWATMNSADQGVFPMDTAFKRRWNFEYLGINENEEEIASIGNIKLAGSEDVINWNTLRKAINAKLSSDDFRINEDKLMGPFFLSKKIIKSDEDGMIEDTEKFIKAFKSKVIMYLYEDAVKQRKHNFFDGCDSSKYSSVCDAFDKKGMGIFGDTFKELYYDKQRNDA